MSLTLHKLLYMAITFSMLTKSCGLHHPLSSIFLRQEDSLEASKILSDLPDSELDVLLKSFIEQLEGDISSIYQAQLRHQQLALTQMKRHRRQATDVSPLNLLKEIRHSLVTDMDFESELDLLESIRVERLDFIGSHGNVKMASYYPIYLTNIPAVFKDGNGQLYSLRSGLLRIVNFHNEWTVNSTGCPCGSTGAAESRSHESCACCVPGNCLCGPLLGFDGESCVPCGKELFLCTSTGHDHIEVDAMVGFEYTKAVNELYQIIVVLRESTVSFFKIVDRDFVPVRMWNGMNSVMFQDSFTHLGYGEALVDSYGIFKKRRFLVYFTAGQSRHALQEVIIAAWDTNFFVSSPQTWETTGTLMKVSQMGSESHVIVQEEQILKIYGFKEDTYHQVRIHFLQKLLFTNSILSWSTLSTGFDHFLIAVTSKQIFVFTVSNQMYKMTQMLIPRGGLQQFGGAFPVHLSSCTSEPMLVAGYGNQSVVYSFSRRSVPTFKLVYSSDFPVSVSDWSSGISYKTTLDDQLQLILIGNSQPLVFSLVTESYQYIEDGLKQQSQIVDWSMEYHQKEYARQIDHMQKAEDAVGKSADVSTVFNANITITKSFIAKELKTNSFRTRNETIPSPDARSQSQEIDYLARFSSVRDKFHKRDKELSTLEKQLEDAVPLDGSIGVVTGYKTIIVSNLHLEGLQTNSIVLKESSLPSLLKQLIRVNDPGIHITGQKIFAGEFSIKHLHTDSMDQIPVDDLVRVDSEQDISGAAFTNVLQVGEVLLHPGATVGKVELSKAIVLKDAIHLGNASFQGSLFVEGKLEVYTEFVNGIDVGYMFTNALQLNGGVVHSSVEFSHPLIMQNLDASLMMNVNAHQFYEDTLFKDLDAVLDGTLSVTNSVTLKNNLLVSEVNDDSAFPDNYMLRSDKSPIVFKNKVSFSQVTFDRLNIATGGFVDGAHPDTLLTRTTDQNGITGKNFPLDIYIEGDLNLSYPIIGGVLMGDMVFSMEHLPPAAFIREIVFEKNVQIPHLVYNGSLNGFNFSAFAADIVFGDSSTVNVGKRRKFTRNFSVSFAKINNHLNGEDTRAFVISGGNQVIAGLKAFHTDVYYDVLNANLIDGVRIDDLAFYSVRLDKSNQNITGKKIFTSLTSIDHLAVEGKMSKVDSSSILTYSDDQVILTPLTFTSATFGSLKANAIHLDEGFLVNKVDLSHIYEKRLPRKSAVDHKAKLVVSGKVNAIGLISPTFINNHNISALQQNIVTDEKSALIKSPVVFSSLYVNGNIDTLHKTGGSGFSLSKISSNAAKIQGTNIFTGFPIFGDLELREDVTVREFVNGINLAELREDAVYRNSQGHLVITGEKTFLSGIHIKGDINTVKTNDIDLSTKMFTRNTDQHLTAHFQFSDIRAGNIFLLGGFNGFGIELLNEMAPKDNKYTVQGSVTMSGDVHIKELVVADSLNNVGLQDRFNDAVKIGESLEISGKKIFITDMHTKHLQTTYVKSKAFTDMLDNMVTKTTETTLLQDVYVTGVISSPWIYVGHLNVEGTVDGENYTSLLQNAIYYENHQLIETELIFENSIMVKGNINASLLNGQSLDEVYLNTRLEQFLPHDARLSNVSALSIDVEGSVNSIELPLEKSVSMQAVDGQLVTGPRIVHGTVRVIGDVIVTGVTGDSSKYKLDSEAIDLVQNVDIPGLVTFNDSLVTSQFTSSKDVINLVNMSRLQDLAWFVDQPTNLSAKVVFGERVTLNAGLTSQRLIDGFNVSAVHKRAASILSTFDNYTDHFKDAYEKMCNEVVTLYEQLEDAIFEGVCFQPLPQYNFSGHHHASVSFNVLDKTYLVMSYEDLCHSEVYLWNRVSASFDFYQTLPLTGYVHHWLVMKGYDAESIFLIAAAYGSGDICARSDTTVWIVEPDGIRMLQTLVPGVYVSNEEDAGIPLLHVHAQPNTVTYSYDGEDNEFSEISRSGNSDLSIFLDMSNGSILSFLNSKEGSEVLINGTVVNRWSTDQKILDVEMFEYHHRHLLVLYISSGIDVCDAYYLKLYEVDYEGNLRCLDTMILSKPGKVTSFIVGNDVCGSLFVVVTQPESYPQIYILQGDVLHMWKELTDHQATWIQHFTTSTLRFPSIDNHYLLLGLKNRSASVVFLVMKGSTVPEVNGRCEVEAFTSPYLAQVVHPRPAVTNISPPPFISSLSDLLSSGVQNPIVQFLSKDTKLSENANLNQNLTDYSSFLVPLPNQTVSSQVSNDSIDLEVIDASAGVSNISSVLLVPFNLTTVDQIEVPQSLSGNLSVTSDINFDSFDNSSMSKQKVIEQNQELKINNTDQHPKSVSSVEGKKSVVTLVSDFEKEGDAVFPNDLVNSSSSTVKKSNSSFEALVNFTDVGDHTTEAIHHSSEDLEPTIRVDSFESQKLRNISDRTKEELLVVTTDASLEEEEEKLADDIFPVIDGEALSDLFKDRIAFVPGEGDGASEFVTNTEESLISQTFTSENSVLLVTEDHLSSTLLEESTSDHHSQNFPSFTNEHLSSDKSPENVPNKLLINEDNISTVSLDTLNDFAPDSSLELPEKSDTNSSLTDSVTIAMSDDLSDVEEISGVGHSVVSISVTDGSTLSDEDTIVPSSDTSFTDYSTGNEFNKKEEFFTSVPIHLETTVDTHLNLPIDLHRAFGSTDIFSSLESDELNKEFTTVGMEELQTSIFLDHTLSASNADTFLSKELASFIATKDEMESGLITPVATLAKIHVPRRSRFPLDDHQGLSSELSIIFIASESLHFSTPTDNNFLATTTLEELPRSLMFEDENIQSGFPIALNPTSSSEINYVSSLTVDEDIDHFSAIELHQSTSETIESYSSDSVLDDLYETGTEATIKIASSYDKQHPADTYGSYDHNLYDYDKQHPSNTYGSYDHNPYDNNSNQGGKDYQGLPNYPQIDNQKGGLPSPYYPSDDRNYYIDPNNPSYIGDTNKDSYPSQYGVPHNSPNSRYPSYQQPQYSVLHQYVNRKKSPWARSYENVEESEVSTNEETTAISDARCAGDSRSVFRPHAKPCNPFHPVKRK